MPSHRQVFDYEPVKPPSRSPAREDDATDNSFFAPETDSTRNDARGFDGESADASAIDAATNASGASSDGVTTSAARQSKSNLKSKSGAKVAETRSTRLRRGHGLTYAGLFLFTLFLYVRPYEFIPALEPLSTFAFPLALFTLAVFLPSQIILEGTLTARPREVNLVLLLCLAGLLSIPLAANRAEAWETFSSVFLKAILMFIVLVNVARTERRLRWLVWIAVVAGCILSLSALNDYRLGNFTVEGYRVKGTLRGWMDNPNDMAIHLVTMTALVLALFFGTKNPLKKLAYAASALLMVAGTVVTFSRGAFLALSFAGATLVFKLARRNRLAVYAVIIVAVVSFVVLVPGNYSDRLLSIVDHSRDPNGSASMRQDVLIRSIFVTLRHPLLGVGMGNFHTFSIRELVSHNAYTQVASEMGLAALGLYLLFIWTPLRRLGQIERETYAARRGSHFYYWSIGLQAALVAYMVSSFFASVAYLWFVYYLVGFAVCLRRLYEAETGVELVVNKDARVETRATLPSSWPANERAAQGGFPLTETETRRAAY